MSVALKDAAWAWWFKKTKKDSPVHRTPGSLDSPVHRTPGSFDSPVLRTILDHQQNNYCDSPVHRTPGSLDSPVHRTPGSLDSPVHRTPGSFDSPVLSTILGHQQINYCDSLVHRTPGSHFKMPITQPMGKKNQNGPRPSLIGPGGVVWGKKPSTQNLVRLSL